MSIWTKAREIPLRRYDVVVAGGGTAGVVAALAAARNGAQTALIEAKGYVGGTIVEGGTALHSYFNLWQAFDVPRRQVVRGIPAEIVDRLAEVQGTSGHAEMLLGYDYDGVCTAIDTEMYKLVAHTMLAEAGVQVMLNTLVTDAIVEENRLTTVVTEGHGGAEAIAADAFIDCTGYGDLAARAGATCVEMNDYPVVNSMALGGVAIEDYLAFMSVHDAVKELAYGMRDGRPGRIVRIDAVRNRLPQGFVEACADLGMSSVTTTVHDDYFMFIKLNTRLNVCPTDRDAVSAAELELRQRQAAGVEVFRQWVPGCEKAFIARTSPSLNIRRARCIACDYDITRDDVLEGRHFGDDVAAYGFHDSAPRLQIKDGGTFGLPYRALCVSGLDNLWAAGMLITSDHDAHMSTRNTVCCMAQGQACGTAAALCADNELASRELDYGLLRDALVRGDVVLEN